MNMQDLQAKMDSLTSKVKATVGVEASAVTLLNTLGAFFLEHMNVPAAIEALATAMTNTEGTLSSSADSLAAAIVANSPTP